MSIIGRPGKHDQVVTKRCSSCHGTRYAGKDGRGNKIRCQACSGTGRVTTIVRRG